MCEQIMVIMRWESYLSVNDRYYRGNRPRLRAVCAAWQEELAWRVKEQWAQSTMSWDDEATLVVDVEMRFPEDDRVRDADNYLKSILDGLEMGLGISDSRMIPFIRDVQVVHPLQAGFTIRIYARAFTGHRRWGRFSMTVEGQFCIVLDQIVSPEWLGKRVCVNLGMVVEEK